MSYISTKLDPDRLSQLACDPLWLPRHPTDLRLELVQQADMIESREDAIQGAFDALRLAQETHPRMVSARHLAVARTLASARLPCVSDADPAAGDIPEELSEMLTQITEARLMLDMAESMLDSGSEACELSARSCMNEAIEWLEPAL